jgi:hypothetical protein
VVVAKRPGQHALHGGDRGAVAAALGLAHDEQAVEQLQTLVLTEHTLLDEPIVLDSHPAPSLEGRVADCHQDFIVVRAREQINVGNAIRGRCYSWRREGTMDLFESAVGRLT